MYYTDTDTPVIDIAPYEGRSENYWWEEVDEQELIDRGQAVAVYSHY